ncbi:MAG TPA: uroporphyrinogen decarboxylase family protein [bacterium]|nr:uroporphyrinogen decarboxylase family protein [bacterium]
MTSRERVKRAITFRHPDQLPHYLPDGKPNDILWLAPWTMGPDTTPPDRQPWTRIGDIDRRIDAWGTVWERANGQPNDIGQAKQASIPDITHQAEYLFPDRNDPRYYRAHRAAIAANNAAENPLYALGVLGFSSLNEGVHNNIGLDQMFLSYHLHPDHLKALIARFAEKQRESIELMAKLGCDGVMLYDDWGLQDRLMVSRDLIREFFLPHYRSNWQRAHDLGMQVWMHSCGCIVDILDDFIDAGLNVIQMDQQENMGLENLSKRFGGRIAFWCPVDIQRTLSSGTPEQVVAYVQRMMQTIGSHNGGLVSMCYTTPEVIQIKPDNIRAMCEAFRHYGVYSPVASRNTGKSSK